MDVASLSGRQGGESVVYRRAAFWTYTDGCMQRHCADLSSAFSLHKINRFFGVFLVLDVVGTVSRFFFPVSNMVDAQFFTHRFRDIQHQHKKKFKADIDLKLCLRSIFLVVFACVLPH